MSAVTRAVFLSSFDSLRAVAMLHIAGSGLLVWEPEFVLRAVRITPCASLRMT